MQYMFEHFGVTVGAITGALAARGKQVDLFGVIVLSFVTSFGGGSLRDLALGTSPVFWVQDSWFVVNAFITAVLTFYLVRWHELPQTVLLIADAFVLAFFTLIGTRKGLAVSHTGTIAVAMGVVTGVMGGVLRDMMMGEIPMVFRREIYLYATAAFFGAAVFVFLCQIPDYAGLDMVISIATTLLLRLAGIRWRITLPLFRPKNTPVPPP